MHRASRARRGPKHGARRGGSAGGARRPWPRLVAALQLVAEEYFEALELESQGAAHRRHLELARLIGAMSEAVSPRTARSRRSWRPWGTG